MYFGGSWPRCSGGDGRPPYVSATANDANPREWGTGRTTILHSCGFVGFVDDHGPRGAKPPRYVGEAPSGLGSARRASPVQPDASASGPTPFPPATHLGGASQVGAAQRAQGGFPYQPRPPPAMESRPTCLQPRMTPIHANGERGVALFSIRVDSCHSWMTAAARVQRRVDTPANPQPSPRARPSVYDSVKSARSTPRSPRRKPDTGLSVRLQRVLP